MEYSFLFQKRLQKVLEIFSAVWTRTDTIVEDTVTGSNLPIFDVELMFCLAIIDGEGEWENDHFFSCEYTECSIE